VRSTEGGSTALAAAAAKWAYPKNGTLLHISGTDVAGDLAGALEQRGFTVRRETLYEAVMRTTLPDDVADALRAGTIDAVLLFSSRSAEAFVSGIKAASLEAACTSVLAIAISPAAAAPLSQLNFREVRTPTRPNQDAMLALL
jgi:uroporphyrinogen-III synthase